MFRIHALTLEQSLLSKVEMVHDVLPIVMTVKVFSMLSVDSASIILLIQMISLLVKPVFSILITLQRLFAQSADLDMLLQLINNHVFQYRHVKEELLMVSVFSVSLSVLLINAL